MRILVANMSSLLISYLKESVERSGIYYLMGEIPVWSEDPLPEHINLRAVLDKIEQMIRYFILMLIGVVGNPTYIDQLSKLRDDMLEKYKDEFDVDPRLRNSPQGLELYEKIKRLSSWIMSIERYF